MRTIKPYGKSIVEKQERKIVSKNGQQPYDISDFFYENEDFFIAQWASMLDKIFPKPNKNNGKYQNINKKN